MDYPHLHPSVVELLELDPQERVHQAWKDLFLHHPTTAEITNRMIGLVAAPRGPGPRGLLIWGPSRVGKSTLLKNFQERFPREPRPDEDAVSIPVVMVDAPVKADERRFWFDILSIYAADFRGTAPLATLERQALLLLSQTGARVLIIDELHNILVQSRRDHQRAFMVILKELCNKLEVPIVAVGDEGARVLIRSDPQLDRRFSKIHYPAWQHGLEFRGFLATFERYIPFPEPSNLSSSALSALIFGYTDGVLGQVSTLLYEASLLAVEKNSPNLTPRLIEAAYSRAFGA